MLHKEPDYPASVSNLSSSERAVARAVVRFKTRMAAETNQAAAGYGLLGVALGVVLGVAGGLTGGSPRASQQGAIIGGILGGINGTALSVATVPLYFQFADAMTTAPLLLLTHAAIFSAVGAAAGAGLGWAWGGRNVLVRCMVGGIVGALVATVAVDVINVVAFGVMRISSRCRHRATSPSSTLESPRRHGSWCGRVWHRKRRPGQS